MAGYYRLKPEDLLPSDKELEMMKTAQSAPGTGEAIGSAIGTGIGAIGGGIIGGIPSLGFGAVPGATLGAGLGSQVGRLIGGGIGGMVAEGPEEELARLQQEREEKITAQQMRDEALRRLLETA